MATAVCNYPFHFESSNEWEAKETSSEGITDDIHSGSVDTSEMDISPSIDVAGILGGLDLYGNESEKDIMHTPLQADVPPPSLIPMEDTQRRCSAAVNMAVPFKDTPMSSSSSSSTENSSSSAKLCSPFTTADTTVLASPPTRHHAFLEAPERNLTNSTNNSTPATGASYFASLNSYEGQSTPLTEGCSAQEMPSLGINTPLNTTALLPPARGIGVEGLQELTDFMSDVVFAGGAVASPVTMGTAGGVLQQQQRVQQPPSLSPLAEEFQGMPMLHAQSPLLSSPMGRRRRPDGLRHGAISHVSLGEVDEEADEMRRRRVAEKQTRVHAARSQVATLVAYQRKQMQEQNEVNVSYASSSDTSDANRVDPELYKVKMCRNVLTPGGCTYQEQCVFAHTPQELRSRETNLDVLKRLFDACKPTVNPLKYKVISCKKFQEAGVCPYNAHCVYAHGKAELRDVNHNMMAMSRIQSMCAGVNYTAASLVSNPFTAQDLVSDDAWNGELLEKKVGSSFF